ncbi:MAG: hypothetical protein IPG58_19880 [Acidobacteria bacterium]|nr:hypothetical protein [Acidobacteriota bacterium]
MKRIFALIIFLGVICMACSTGRTSNQWTTISSSPDPPTPPAAKQSPSKAGYASKLPEGFTNPTDDAGKRLLKEYGAVFVGAEPFHRMSWYFRMMPP